MIRKITYREAVREALQQALRQDPRVFLMGEDVGAYGGTYAVSKGLLDEFGPERIRDTPLSELGFVGAVFVLLHGASYVLYPELMPEFLKNIGEIQGLVPVEAATVENFAGAPATWPLIKTLITRLSAKLAIPAPSALPVLVFAGVALTVCGITWVTVRRYPCSEPGERNRMLVVFACLVYLLLTPRLMVGEYAVGLLPAYYIIRRMRYVNASLLLVALMIPAPITGRSPGFKFLIETCTNYYPLLTVYAIWALGVYAHWTMHSDPCDGPGLTGRALERPEDAARGCSDPHRESSAGRMSRV